MKSLAQKLGELTEKIADKGKWSAYVEAVKNCTSLEAKINAAESVLRTIKEVSESRGPITKHNGVADNGHESFTESARRGAMTETTIPTGDAALYKGLGISEADQRRLNGLPPAGESLTPSQLREFRFLRSIRLSEADALKGARKVA